MWTPDAATSLIAWFVFIYWQLSGSRSMSKDFRREYDAKMRYIRFAPPGWLFGVAWFVLYGLITAAAFLYFGPTQGYETSQYYLAAYIVLFVNIVLNKFWSVLFFDQRRIGWALAVAVVLLLSAIAVVVLFGLTQAWTPFGLFMPYPLWLIVALYLNAVWLRAPKVEMVPGDGRRVEMFKNTFEPSPYARLRNE